MSALIIFPSYLELIDYCSGFMVLDLPWLNSYFAETLSDWTETLPPSYTLFYSSMNLGSTYFLPAIILLTLSLILASIYYIFIGSRQRIMNIASFLYNVFIAGVTVATTSACIGALNNPIQTFTINGLVYIIGIIILLCLILDGIYCVHKYR